LAAIGSTSAGQPEVKTNGAAPQRRRQIEGAEAVRKPLRSSTAALAVIMALVATPEAIVTIQTPGQSRADVCGDVGGRHVDVGGCT